MREGKVMSVERAIRFSDLARLVILFAALVLGVGTALAGNVTYTVDPASGRVTRATYPDGSYITYTYDLNGNRTSAVVTLAVDTTPPTQPGALSFSAITATSATVSWGASSDNVGVASYEWSRNAGSTWTNVGNALTANITGLTGSTNYTVLVRARDAAGNTSTNRSGSFDTADITAPTQPGALVFSAITATTATVSWTASTDNVGVTSYEWSRNAGSTWTNVGNVLTANLTGLTGSTSYTVLVRARDAANNVSANRSGTFSTADVTAPSQPGALVFSAITAISATVTWTASTDNVAVTSYEWSRNAGSTWTNVGNVLSANITGLTGSTSYTVLVRARDAANNVSTNSSGTFTTAAAADTTNPSAPGVPAISSITATTATATWTAATDNVGVTSYEYSINGGGSWSNVGNVLTTGLTGLTNGTAYTFQVRAKDAANNVGTPSSSSFTTLDNTAPSAPGTPTFSAITATSATASWTAATDNVGIASYEYSTNGGGSWTNVGNVLSASLTGLTGSTTYSVQVRAKDAANNTGAASAASLTTSDTTAPGAPGTPTFSSITATTATASWGAATDNIGVSSYEYSTNGGGSWTNVGNALSAGLTGLSGSTTYTVHVRARDAAGNVGSSSSNSFTTTDVTPPSAPGTPSFSSITGSSATASWGAATDNVGVSSYEWSINGGGSWNNVGGAQSASITGLSGSTTYTVHVRARDAAGNAGNSSSNSFTTADTTPPSAPGAPSFSSIGSTTAVASWSAASDNVGVARYEYSVNGGGWVNVGNTTSATVSGLTAATSNTVAIRAVDGANNTGSSSSGSVTTLAQVTISNRSISTVVSFSGSAVYQLRASGDIWASGTPSSTVTDVGDWLAPKSGMGSYEVNATALSGTCTAGPMGAATWTSLSADVAWAIGKGPPAGSASCTFDLKIRHTSNPSVILGTAQIALTITTQ
jgi:YD repeat-containing protein